MTRITSSCDVVLSILPRIGLKTAPKPVSELILIVTRSGTSTLFIGDTKTILPVTLLSVVKESVSVVKESVSVVKESVSVVKESVSVVKESVSIVKEYSFPKLSTIVSVA